MQFDGHHADRLGELHDVVVHLRVGVGRAHDLSGIELPDPIGKVQCQEPIGASGPILEVAGQQRRGVGDKNGLGWGERRQLPVDLLFESSIDTSMSLTL